MSNREPPKPTLEECRRALNAMICAYSTVPIDTDAKEEAFNRACTLANKLYRRELWEQFQDERNASY